MAPGRHQVLGTGSRARPAGTRLRPNPTRCHAFPAPGCLAGLLLAAAMGLAAAACSSSTSGSATTTSVQSRFSCDEVPATTVDVAFNFEVIGPTSTVNGSVTICTYEYAIGPGNVIIRVQSGVDKATFESTRKEFEAHHESITEVRGLGDAAFSTSFGLGQLESSSVVVLKGSSELTVSVGPGVSAAQVEAFAKALLPAV